MKLEKVRGVTLRKSPRTMTVNMIHNNQASSKWTQNYQAQTKSSSCYSRNNGIYEISWICKHYVIKIFENLKNNMKYLFLAKFELV